MKSMLKQYQSQSQYKHKKSNNTKKQMLTPQFKITQNDTDIVIVLRLPYVKVSSCEFYIEQNCFKFYLKPYLLSLIFEQPLKQVEQPAKATYYHEKHFLEVHLSKKNVGEHFENLNLLSSLLNKNKTKDAKKVKKNLVEVINQQGQIIKTQKQQTNIYAYGFCHNYSKVFEGLEEEMCEILCFKPDQVCIADRFEFCQKLAESCFDQDAYLFDKFQNQEIQSLLKSTSIQKSIQKLITKSTQKQPQSYPQFKSTLKLTNKELIIPTNQEPSLIKQLLSISISYMYELCCMDGDLSVESAKTINMTCPVLSCCVDFGENGVGDVVRCSLYRCVVYSLYKDVGICEKIRRYLVGHLSQEFFCAVLENLREMFNKSQPRYLLNTIFIDDYLLYCLKSKLEGQIEKLREQLKSIVISQQFLGIDCEEESSQDEEQENEIQQKQEQKISMKKQPKIVEIASTQTQPESQSTESYPTNTQSK